MPDDLLRYLMDAPPTPMGWLWGVGIIVTAVTGWYLGVLWWTAPGRAEPVVVGAARTAMTRRRALRAIADTRKRYRSADLSAPAAASDLSGHVRRFLRESTGQRVEYLQLPEIAEGALAPAAPVLTALDDVQFNRDTITDVEVAADAAERLVREWI
ncbi:hypothetical protein QWI29_25285 [Mycolicibacterium neoaurum]|uniref:hypothetical protein n=1 Tax=Mycolicibacterium neoaurum TaxID=1795 RepID=UPI002672FD40|nr:hypothetical protein [Mycolicibacterium neoaurum]MDO3403371.1 hypothetical protein [Mycolicibacterium neoaurum]